MRPPAGAAAAKGRAVASPWWNTAASAPCACKGEFRLRQIDSPNLGRGQRFTSSAVKVPPPQAILTHRKPRRGASQSRQTPPN
jgi:hypothetical protein